MKDHRTTLGEFPDELHELRKELDELTTLYERDLSKHRLAEDASIASETRYRRLFETAKDGILILDAETGMIMDVNPFLINLLGYSKEQFIEKAIWEIGFFKDILANQEKFLELQQQEYVRYEDLPLETAHGRKINVEFVSNVYLVNCHRVIQCNIRDITERRWAVDEIRKLNVNLEERITERTNQLENTNQKLQFRINEVEQFAYITNHDLKEPLRTLTNFTQLLFEDYSGQLDENGRKYIGFIHNSALRMMDLVTDLSEYSLIGKESKMKIVDCNKSVAAVISDFTDFIKRNNAIITVQKLPSIICYETELRLLFQSLINNAIKYRKKDMAPEIRITAVSHKKEWLFSIKDNGIGIDKSNYTKIFIIFQRLHNRSEFEGTGIGLAHCKKIVELHGGKIWVESTPGEGSVFKFTIPKINNL